MAKNYAIGLSDIQILIADPVGVTTEVDTLTITAAATGSGNVTVTLGGTAFTVAVASGDTTAQVAEKIRAASFAGWVVTGTNSTAIFTATVGGVKTAPSFNGGTTGVTGTFVVTRAGVDNPFGTVLTTIGEVAENSTQFVQEAPTETKFKGDYGDATLMTLFQNGDISLETDIIEVSGAKMAALTGALWVPSTKTMSLPTSAPILFGQCVLTFDQGFDKIKIWRGQIVGYITGANVKTEMFKLHIKVTAVPDVTGYVDIVTK